MGEGMPATERVAIEGQSHGWPRSLEIKRMRVCQLPSAWPPYSLPGPKPAALGLRGRWGVTRQRSCMLSAPATARPSTLSERIYICLCACMYLQVFIYTYTNICVHINIHKHKCAKEGKLHHHRAHSPAWSPTQPT